MDTILLIEDNFDEAELARHALSNVRPQANLEVAGSGQEALKKLDQGLEPGLILLDLKMYGFSGHDVLERLQKRKNKIPVLVLSSSHEPGDVQKSYELGANGYLVKPVSLKEFIELLASACTFWLTYNIRAQ
jgi:two-component system response regulator